MLNLFGFGNGQDVARFSQIGVSLGFLYYLHAKVCFEITFGEGLSRVKTSKLICKENQWTSFCVMRLLQKGLSEQAIILQSWAKHL